jgi:hypothetical protein
MNTATSNVPSIVPVSRQREDSGAGDTLQCAARRSLPAAARRERQLRCGCGPQSLQYWMTGTT